MSSATSATGLGQELLAVHRQLRVRVSQLERALEAGLDDVADFGRPCLAFCRGLRRHHIGEDDGAFEVLHRHRPDLGDVLDALTRDHEFLNPMLDRLEGLLSAGDAEERGALEREVGGIAALLENHLAYEERVLVAVLDSLEVEAGSADEAALRAPLDGIF